MGMGIMTAMSLGSNLMGVAAANRQARQKAANAEYQAKIAEQNQHLALNEAAYERKYGHRQMLDKKREGARQVGKIRAAAGASGTLADLGSNMDAQNNAHSEAEIAAINAYNQGLDKAYANEVKALNYGQQAAQNKAAAKNIRKRARMNTGLSMTRAALGGIASVGTTWGK